MTNEVFAGIKVLVALAQADGKIHDNERIAIENALDGAELPHGLTVTCMLASEIDLPAELARITTEETRKRTYGAACALVYVDGHFSEEERTMLEQVGSAFGLGDGSEASYERYKSVTPPSSITKMVDRAKRDIVIADEITNAAAFSAVLASTSLPIAAESCLFTNNVRLARNIGLAYGHDADDAFWRTFTVNVVGSAASWFALSSLLKLIPGSTAAASAAYASTFALGEVTRLYFEEGEALEPAALREAFLDAKRDGQDAAREASIAITERRAMLRGPKAALDAQLAAGSITETRYADKLVALEPGAFVPAALREERAA